MRLSNATPAQYYTASNSPPIMFLHPHSPIMEAGNRSPPYNSCIYWSSKHSLFEDPWRCWRACIHLGKLSRLYTRSKAVNWPISACVIYERVAYLDVGGSLTWVQICSHICAGRGSCGVKPKLVRSLEETYALRLFSRPFFVQGPWLVGSNNTTFSLSLGNEIVKIELHL